MSPAMGVEVFDDRESEYLDWVARNPAGYIANMDRAERVPQYPMIHRATHRAVSSDRIGGFTTGAYLKLCSTDLDVLQRELQDRYRRAATQCKQCM